MVEEGLGRGFRPVLKDGVSTGGTMSQTITVMVRCDERTAPTCHDHYTVAGASLDRFEAFAMELYQQGWVRGYRRDGFYDVCPSCGTEWALREAARSEVDAAPPDDEPDPP